MTMMVARLCFFGLMLRTSRAFGAARSVSVTVSSAWSQSVVAGPCASAYSYPLCICSAPVRDTLVVRRLSLASWETNNEDAFDNDGDDDDDDDDDSLKARENEEDSTIEEDASVLFLREHAAWCQAVDKAITGLERKEQALQSELNKAQDVENTVARGQLIVSNLYLFTSDPSLKQVTVQDWENDGQEVKLILNSEKYDSASAEADALFVQARKLKRGSQVIGSLLEETEDALKILLDAKNDLASCLGNDDPYDEGRFSLVQTRLERTSKTTKFATPSLEQRQHQSLNASKGNHSSSNSSKKGNKKKQQQQSNKHILETCVRKLTSPAGLTVWVGRNRRGNEYLSFQVARGSDVWMHARGSPGAHVVLQNRRGSQVEPTEACWQFCADLAIFYSDSRTERKAPVTAAEPKHIQKPRGAPLGAVKVREELQILMGCPDDVPEELKLARDESGLTDEFRSKDKAKHRKRTKAVAKQNQLKRRAVEQASKRKRRQSSTSSGADPADSFDPY